VLVARTPLPIPDDDLHVTVLYDEPRALLVPASHRLAGKESVSPDDFADEPLVACAGMAAAWTEFWRLAPRPDGNPAPLSPMFVDTFEDKLEVVADGRAIAIVPINGIEPCQVVVVTRTDDRNPLVARFRESAKNCLTRDA
jgi:DNA-binding transcriptional LysR family regulator